MSVRSAWRVQHAQRRAPRPWQPSDLAVWVFSKQIIAALPDDGDQAILSRLELDHDPTAADDLDRLTPDGRLVQQLFAQPSRARIDEILAVLPPSVPERLRAISPSTNVDRLRTALFVMHDRSDVYIPFTESRHLVATAPPGTLRAYTEFDLFSHVMPDRPLGGLDFLRELAKLYWHAYRFCLELL